MPASDPASRAADRHRRAALTAFTSVTARVIRIGVSLVTVPLTLHYLGTERFGLWMTISSVLAMAGFADFGIGNGVLNTVSEAFGKDDSEGIKRAISSGLAVLSIISALLLIGFFLAYGFVSWGHFFNVKSALARAEAGPAMAIFVVCFALNIPFDVVQRTQLGLQQGFRTNFWQVFSSIVILLGILAVIHFHLSLPMLIVALAGAPVFGTALNALHFFGSSRRDLLPQWHLVSRKTIAQIARLGGLFFILQLAFAISYSADNFIVARNLGPTAVTVFSIPDRMFSMLALLVTMLITPLWPAYGEAISRGDMDWVRRTLVRTLLAVFSFTTVASLVLLLLADKILLWWVGPTIHPPFLLLLGLAIWTVIGSCGATLAVFLNGASIIKFQIIIASIFSLGCLAIKIVFTRHFGIVGVPWATVLTYILLNAIPCAVYVPRLLNRMAAPHTAPDARSHIFGGSRSRKT
ncbi:MAG: oligosaccharide flippase family protein [Acidobacteriaceae bacterium]